MRRFLPRRAAAISLALAGALPLAAQACDDEPYMGSICFVAGTFCPKNYSLADGSALPTATNQALFSLISVIYGGDGHTTFNLPDLRARMPIATGQGAGLPAIALAQALGQATLTLDNQQAPLAAHTHQAGFSPAPAKAVTVALPAAASTLAVTAKLPVSGTAGASTIKPGDQLYLSALTGTGTVALTITGPYLASLAGDTVQLSGNAAVKGSAGRAATTVQVQGMTGGAVLIGAPTARAVAPVPIQSPGVGLTACIATGGLFPPNQNNNPTLSLDAQ